MSRVTPRTARKRLATVWFFGAGVIFLLVLLQSLSGFYGGHVEEAWNWLLPAVMPTLSLVVAVLTADARGKTADVKSIDAFMYRLAMGLSVVYIVVVGMTIFAAPLTSMTQLELMRISNLWLGPFQGLVTGALGVFFLRGAN